MHKTSLFECYYATKTKILQGHKLILGIFHAVNQSCLSLTFHFNEGITLMYNDPNTRDTDVMVYTCHVLPWCHLKTACWLLNTTFSYIVHGMNVSVDNLASEVDALKHENIQHTEVFVSIKFCHFRDLR